MRLTTSTLRRNDVFVKNGDDGHFAVVVEEHRNNGEVRWVNHPVPRHTTAGRSSPVDRFLKEYTPVDRDSDLARSVVKGARVLVEKLPAPTRWGY
jgi:DNA-binding cell septation regulator SpoVG